MRAHVHVCVRACLDEPPADVRLVLLVGLDRPEIVRLGAPVMLDVALQQHGS